MELDVLIKKNHYCLLACK